MADQFRMTRPTRLALRALTDGPTWGYEILRQTGLAAGTLYPLLARLTAHGVMTVTEETGEHPGRPARRYYELTASGRERAATVAGEEQADG